MLRKRRRFQAVKLGEYVLPAKKRGKIVRELLDAQFVATEGRREDFLEANVRLRTKLREQLAGKLLRCAAARPRRTSC